MRRAESFARIQAISRPQGKRADVTATGLD
jgi:hypothetical protein